MISKIADQHLSRQACIYIRQSTMGQVRFNQESTERHYNLASKAQSLGWSSERIRILDRDLGQSGARTTNREDFKTLVSDVAASVRPDVKRPPKPPPHRATLACLAPDAPSLSTPLDCA